MSTIAVLGAGAGGAAAVVELTRRCHAVRLWNRPSETLESFKASGCIAYEGVLGSGEVVPERISSDLEETLEGADVILVCVPTLAHADIARKLVERGVTGTPIVLNPGHTGGALEVHHAFVTAGRTPPPIAEFSTPTYVARKFEPARVTITG